VYDAGTVGGLLHGLARPPRFDPGCHVPIPDRFIITAISGMRQGEIFKLKWDHIDLKNRLIFVEDSKNQESREIPMNPTLTKLI
jgi:integrase